jgi:purine nucleosidase/pyrimidine-specific ribonucleoside hydrolase
MDPIKVILDTDLGDDIDDAWALATCLGHPLIDLAGVATVWQDTQLRAAQTRKLLELAGRPDIPVAAGARDGLDCINALPRNNQADLLSAEDEARLREGRDDGVRLLAELAEANPGATLLTIGALTDAARLIVEFPQAYDKLERVVIMGGHMIPTLAHPEYNTQCDPRASQIVFRSSKPVTMVGLDVTLKCQMTQDDLDTVEAKGTPLSRALIDMTNLWRKLDWAHLPIIHDPLAALVCVEPNLVTLETRRVKVDEVGHIVADAQGEEVAVAVDVRPDDVRRRVVELCG